VRILLDENMPRKLRDALIAEGHEVDSVRSLRMDGIDNGALYELAARAYDVCFTRDAAFVNRVREAMASTHLKLVRVVIPQTRQDEFVGQFVATFRQTDWTEYANGDDWPKTLRALDS
jgi:predicted nuclease of predicted toxin-antitoxin system